MFSGQKFRGNLTTEVIETNFEVDGVMIRSSKEDLVWFESCWVEELMCWVKPVEFSKSARSSSISLGEVPGKLKSQEIIRQSTASVPRVARSEPNSPRNIDLLAEGGRYMFASTMLREWRPMLTSWNSKNEWAMLCSWGKTFISSQWITTRPPPLVWSGLSRWTWVIR